MQQAHANDPSWKSGDIYIKPLRAVLTRDTDTVTKMSPYIIFQVGGIEVKSHTVSGGGKTPHWDEQLSIKAKRGDQLIFEVWNHNTVGKDVIIGKGSIKVDSIPDEDDGDTYQYFHALQFNEQEVGKLLFAAAVTSPVKVWRRSNDVEELHKEHMKKAANFKQGFLYFRPIKAKLTHDTDLIRKMSPMVIMTWAQGVEAVKDPAKHAIKTKVCHMGGKEPKWEDELEVPVVRGHNLKLQIWNHHTIGKDELVAECEINVDDIIDFKRHYQETIDLFFEGKPAGTIDLAASLLKPVKVEDIPDTPEGRYKIHKKHAVDWQEGYVYLRPYEAKIIRDTAGTLKMMDPYLIIKHGDKEFKTKNGHTKNPSWDEEFRIYAKRGDRVILECWDHHIGAEHKLIGTHTLIIDDVIDSEKHYEYNHAMWCGEEKAGSIAMSASLISGVLSGILIERAKRRAEKRQEIYEDVKLFFEIVEKIGHMGHHHH